MTARHHHYLSQCYLKGFTKGRAKKSKLCVLDPKGKKVFQTIPRNVGGVRDFNRIEAQGIDQNTLESALAKFESQADVELKTLRKSLEFSGRTRDVILNLIALLAVRSPEGREHMRKFQAEVIERLMALTLHSKERWESQISSAKADGVDLPSDIKYEDMKKFFDSKQYRIEVAREHHIHMEMVQVEAVVPWLFRRNWTLLLATDQAGPFITSDRPVNLSWKDPMSVPPLYRHSPGFGLTETEVYFPVSQDLALLGEFDGEDRTIRANEKLVAMLNSKTLYSFYNHVYAPTLGFKFYGKGMSVRNGRQLATEFGP